MATYLEICQKVARDSGTFPEGTPTAIAGQEARTNKVIAYVAEAWRSIQNERAGWLWMEAEFSGATIAGTARYTAASWSLTRWADWIIDSPHHDEPSITSIYPVASGQSQEGPLPFLPYRQWRRIYAMGTHDQNQPIHYSISPAGEFCLGPTPDAAYQIGGLYRKSPQVLASDGDIPEMPARFHDLIAFRASILLHKHDIAPFELDGQIEEHNILINDLYRDQLPTLGTHRTPSLA